MVGKINIQIFSLSHLLHRNIIFQISFYLISWQYLDWLLYTTLFDQEYNNSINSKMQLQFSVVNKLPNVLSLYLNHRLDPHDSSL